MAITPNQGIMALPAEGGEAMPQLSYMDSYDAARQGLQQARPDADLELQEALDEIRANLSELSDDELGQMVAVVQQLVEDPENYAQNVAQLVQQGAMEQGDLPAEYDEEFLGAMLTVLLEEQRSRQSMATMPAPQGFARGGIAEAARIVANAGRNGDTMLAHITPQEAELLRSRGGSGTINPATGLPEFFIDRLFKGIGKVFTSVGKGIKKVLSSPIGKIIGTIALTAVLGPAGLALTSNAAIASGLASGAVSALSGGDLKQILTSTVLGYASAPSSVVSNFVGKYTGQFITNPVVKAAADAAIIGTGAGLVTGQNFKDAVKNGLTSGVIAGGISYAQNRGNLQAAKIDAEDAAATAAAPVKAGVAVVDEVLDPTGTPGLFNKKTTFADGRVVQQAVDGRGTPIGPETPIAPAAPVSPTPPAPSSPVSSSYTGDGTRSFPNLSGALPDAPLPAATRTVAAPPSAPTPATPPVTPPVTPYKVPEVGKSLSKMGGGIKDIATGKFETGATRFMEGAEDLFMPGPSSEQYQNMISDLRAKDPTLSVSDAIATIEKSKMLPGALRTYGPAIVGGTLAAGAAGAFDVKQPPESELAKQLRAPIDYSTDARKYMLQDLPGVIYDERGMPIGRGPKAAPLTLADIRMSTPSYASYVPRYNAGGIAALARGGYPRRTGQISGPGTPTSDSIPAMLSDGEFVMTEKAVRGAGNGSRREGARKMYALMHQLERNAARG
jgi:hypothetical protein